MFAIRCRDHNRSFRRDGVVFTGNSWTFQEDATPAQRDEPMLLVVEVESEEDPRLAEFALPELQAPQDAPQEMGTPSDFDIRVHNEQLERANAELTNEVANLNAQMQGALGQVGALKEQIRALTSPTIAVKAPVSEQARQADQPTSGSEVSVHTEGAIHSEGMVDSAAGETSGTETVAAEPSAPSVPGRSRNARLSASDVPTAG